MSAIKQNLYRVVVVAMLSATGCSSTDPVRVEEDFGNSVRNMVNAQIYNPNAAKNPPAEPPLALDGEKADKVLEAYRGDVYKPEKAERPISIRIGAGR